MDRDSYIYYRSWENQEISRLWWNPNDHNSVQMSPRLAVTLSEVNVAHIPVLGAILFPWPYQVDCPITFLDFISYEFLISPLSCYMYYSPFSSWLYNAWFLWKIVNFEALYHSFFVLLPPETLTLRRLMSYIYGAPILDVSRSHTTTQHSR